MRGVGVWPRALAGLIDLFALVLVSSCVLLFLGYDASESDGDLVSMTEDIPPWLNLMGIVSGIVYFTVLEAASGTTLGKRILKLRVVRTNGAPITVRDALVRNVFRILDGFLLYAVGVIAILTSSENQRLGDRVAGTIVVRTAQPEPERDDQERF